MSLYKLDPCPDRINTSRMTRVCYHHELVACFSSYADAQAFVVAKEAERALARAKAQEDNRKRLAE